ncbi:VOC family protein [Bermanella sp. R86510]|uniref:VOC family protein n=1 Tax=unclassified Bermanella TaxID=2627862 RepID=UPI0037C9172F
MKNIVPYLFFYGQCQQALDFYCRVFNGTVSLRTTFAQAPQAIPGVNPSHIMHAEFKADGLFFMASDGLQGELTSQHTHNQVCLNVQFDSEQEQLEAYQALSESGEIDMALQETFWGAKFAQITDEFGIKWMLNYQLSQQHE